jgi:uncharacterized membrane protein
VSQGKGRSEDRPPASAERRNIQAIIDLEREAFQARSLFDRVTDHVSAWASSAVFIVAHVVWFVVWIVVNNRRAMAFDPYPYSLLTLAVSLEAIVLTGFVLMAQDRMTQQADRRARLDLQVNLLAEQELTAILRMLSLLATRAGIDVSKSDPQLDQFLTQTDVRQMAEELDNELAGKHAARDAAEQLATSSR